MTLILLDDRLPAHVIARVPQGTAERESPLRDLIFDHPEILPLDELDPGIGRVIPVATELKLPGAGILDVLLISEHGRLIVVECKLWRNPQARREVVGQVLDYAGELARTGYEGLQRAISSRLKRPGNLLHQLIADAGGTISESALVDRVERDLSTGRFSLLIVGDGITEGAQRIGAFLSRHAGLAFELALVEIAEYRFTDPDSMHERRILFPRLLARTAVIERHVIRSEVTGIVVEELSDQTPDAPLKRSPGSPSTAEAAIRWRAFVGAFTRDLCFDDPAQMPPRPGGVNWMKLPLADGLSVTLWRSSASQEVGAQIRFVDADATLLYDALIDERHPIEAEFEAEGLPLPGWLQDPKGALFQVTAPAPLSWDDAADADQQRWFARVANRVVNSLKPRLQRLEEEV
jgi:hypothetical protein